MEFGGRETDRWLLGRIQEKDLSFLGTPVVLSQGLDSVSGFINHACLVMDRALRVPAVLDVVLAEESSDNPVWKTVSLLQATVSKTSRPDEIVWIFQYMRDAKLAGFLQVDGLTTRFLTGTAKDHNKGYIDLVLFKLRFRNYLTSEFLTTEGKDLKEAHRTALRELCQDVATFRQKVGYPNRKSDLSWKAGWPAAADAALQLFEDQVCFHSLCSMIVSSKH